jgi:hypothetical protein
MNQENTLHTASGATTAGTPLALLSPSANVTLGWWRLLHKMRTLSAGAASLSQRSIAWTIGQLSQDSGCSVQAYLDRTRASSVRITTSPPIASFSYFGRTSGWLGPLMDANRNISAETARPTFS